MLLLACKLEPTRSQYSHQFMEMMVAQTTLRWSGVLSIKCESHVIGLIHGVGLDASSRVANENGKIKVVAFEIAPLEQPASSSTSHKECVMRDNFNAIMERARLRSGFR